MRVLHISGGNLYGGVETVLVTLARYHQVLPALEQEFAICFEARLSTELAATGVPVHLLGEVRTRRPLTVWRARRKLRGLLRERQIDVIVVTWRLREDPKPSSVGNPLKTRCKKAYETKGFAGRLGNYSAA